MRIQNLTNSNKDPVEGDEMLKMQGNLEIRYTHSAVELPAEDVAREWRNSELVNTDMISQIPDWPDRDKYITYRTKLRDWPSTSDFPDTKPELELGSE